MTFHFKKAPPAYHQGKEEDGKLLEVLLEMKSGGTSHQKVTLEKENRAIILASVNQLAELAKYSTSGKDFSIVK